MNASLPVKGSFFTPIVREVLADTETPVSLYLKIKDKSKFSFLFESVEGEKYIARYTYIGLDPFAIFHANATGVDEGKIKFEIRDKAYKFLSPLVKRETNPILAMQWLFDALKSDATGEFITSGAFGYVGYDAVHLVEKIPEAGKDELKLDDICLLFFDSLFVYDGISRKVFIVSNARRGDEKSKAAAEKKLDNMASLIANHAKPKKVKLSAEKSAVAVSNTTKPDYLAKVLRCKDYITEGDIFQVQISQRLKRPLKAEPFDVYRKLRTINPSPYLFYIQLDKLKIAGSSPELLVRVDAAGTERIVQTRPIAGTRKRGATKAEDEILAKELLADEKERAEHLMLIDLGRNDIGRIAKTGSVEVDEMMVIEKYSAVMHIVSNVKGNLRDDLTALDAFWACFPAGTLTGAPKIRSMEIIYELESDKRGLYGGAVGYFDFAGNLNTAIAIRTIIIKNKMAYFQAAAGIVADSVPESEYEETMNKMRANLRAVESLVAK
jgi:anthranilate synthase component 1